jgi:gliding motility-associated-like protein
VECTAPLNPAVTNCQWTYAQNGVGASLSCEDNIFVLEDPGCYQLTHTVTDGAGCTNSLVAPNLLCLSAPPSSDFAISPAHPSLFDPLLEVWATDSVAENDYLWEVAGAMWLEGPSQVLSIPDIGEDVFNLCLQVVDSVECSSLTCHPIELTEGLNAYAPNAFTPDNDGHNDAWRMYVSGSVTRFELQIFDRWGALVFATTDPEEHWVGEVMGGAHFAPDGVYHFQAVLRDDSYQIKTLQGHILLIR